MKNSHTSRHPAALRLSGRRLLEVLMTLGWSERTGAHRCRMHRTSFKRCVDGSSTLDPVLSEWLLDLERAFRENPCPRMPVSDRVYQATLHPGVSANIG